MREIDRMALEVVEQHPEPGTNPIDRLQHTVAMFTDEPDSDWAIVATGNIYGQGVRTGLTWGDLRTLLELVQR
jgi:hypothetical protein